MKRFEAIEGILENIGETDLALFTTGMISREAFSAKDRDANFYMIGSMGLLAAMGLGIALNKPDRRIVVVEGDGSALMSLGALPLIAHEAPGNFKHIILDNEAYESTGNQPSISEGRDLAKHAEASGYAVVDRAEDLAAFTEKFKQHCATTGPTCLVAKVGGRGSHSIPRIDLDPPDLKDRFRSQC